ncbi:DUF4232 domain-containing protein [Streptomyces sp. NPDC056411]|uniref:DUF4232 domain-containing protein n=1 Tax=Streptomyces sp. NPDC056411 TaxID=3345813 RepID=UPI0035D550DD
MRSLRARTTVATVAALASLSLSACEDLTKTTPTPRTDGTNAGAAASQPGGAGDGDDQAHGTQHGDGKGASGHRNGSSGKPGNGGAAAGTGDGSLAPCTGSNTTAVVSKPTRPINHLLLKVTNKGSHACQAYFAPLLRFDDEQAATRTIEDSKPQAVVTVAPGGSAYASIMLSGAGGGDTGGRTAKRLTVYFAPRSGSGSTGEPSRLTLPSGTHKDDNAAVTYWQTSASDALTY